MTLTQFHSLKTWHLRHSHRQPVEKHVWDTVLTAWCIGFVGGPAALVLGAPAGLLCSFGLLFLPELYVKARARLHRTGRLRCDWIVVIR